MLSLLFALIGFLWVAQGNYAERSSRLSILICGARGKMPLGWNNNARSDAELGKVPGDKTLPAVFSR